MKLRRSWSGFTLIELLVVIAIIGLLATVILVSLNSARQKARDVKRLADIRQIMTALELFYNDKGGFPVQGTALVIHGYGLGSASNVWTTSPSGTLYVQRVNAAPLPFESGCTAANNSYTYTATVATDYTLRFCLGAATGGYSAGLRTATAGGIQ